MLTINDVIVGGYAVALHGAVRSTVDIDFILQWTQDNLLNAEQALKALGLVSQHPLDANTVYQQRDQLYKEKI